MVQPIRAILMFKLHSLRDAFSYYRESKCAGRSRWLWLERSLWRNARWLILSSSKNISSSWPLLLLTCVSAGLFCSWPFFRLAFISFYMFSFWPFFCLAFLSSYMISSWPAFLPACLLPGLSFLWLVFFLTLFLLACNLPGMSSSWPVFLFASFQPRLFSSLPVLVPACLPHDTSSS